MTSQHGQVNYSCFYHIETHSAPLTTLFLSIQDAPGMNPADPLGCLYLSIQIENVFIYGRGYWDRTSDDRVKVCSVTATLTPNNIIVECYLAYLSTKVLPLTSD